MLRDYFLSSSIILLSVFSTNSLALGECGLACCLAGANSSGVTLAKNFGLSVQYEYSDMTTILNGTDTVTPIDVINNNWMMGSSYAAPTKMIMEKLSLIGALPLNERWQLMAITPFIRNNMDMKMKNAMGMVMDMSMDTLEGLGDISLLANYVIYTDAPIRATERLSLGFGLKLPTGNNTTRSTNGKLVHAMMQAGSGSWDPLLTINYMRAWYPLVMQVSGFYHLTTKGDEGYEFGDQIGLDVMLRRQVSDYFNLGLAFNAIHTVKDIDHDGKYTKSTMNDNVNNTGLTSILITPGVQYKIPSSGGSVGLKYQLPIYQDVNGYQQVLDSRLLLSINWVW